MRLMSNRYDRQANLWISGPNPVKADYLNKFSNAWTQYIEEATGEAVTVLTNVILVLLAIFALLQIEGQTFAELRTNVVISEVRFETTMKSLLCSRWFVIGSVVN